MRKALRPLRLTAVVVPPTGQHPDKRTLKFKALHTLALARLRQGRPGDVRGLCADALAADREPDDRASVLETVAMARHALLLSGRQQPDEAFALDAQAALVAEAVRVVGGGPGPRCRSGADRLKRTQG